MLKKITLLLLLISKLTLPNVLNNLKQIEHKNRNNYIQEKIDSFKEKHVDNDKLDENLPDNFRKDQHAILISKIIIDGVYDYKKEIESLKKNFQGKKLTLEQINSLSNFFTDFFLSKGDISTKVIFISGNLEKEELYFKVLPGTINSIEIYDANNKNILKEKINIPIKSGDILNIEKLDQTFENLSLGKWDYNLHLLPSDEDIYNFESNKWNIIILGEKKEQNMVLGLDNGSYKNLGEYQWYSSFQYGDLLGLSDLWSFSSIDRIIKSRESNRETATNLSFEIPIKTFKFKYTLEHGYNKNTVNSLSRYTIKSKIQSHKLSLQKPIHRNKFSRTSLISNFYLRNYNTTLNNIKISVNSKRYSNTTLGIEHLQFLQGGILYLLIEFEKGVPWFESEKNTKEIKLSGYNMEYEKFNLVLNWEKNLNNSFLYNLKSSGTYSKERLLSINQFSIGDLYTVRGFKESSVNGNQAIYFNNTLSYLKYTPFNFIDIVPFIGADIGWSKDKDLSHSDNLIGIATGIEVNYKNLFGKLTFGKPIKIPNGLKKEKYNIYMSIQYKF